MKCPARLFIPVTLLILINGLLACSSSKLVARWNDTEYTGPVLTRVLVIGMVGDDIKRRYFEDEFIKQIAKSGHQGVPGYRLMPDLKDYDDKAKLAKVVSDAGVDAVLVATLQAVDKEMSYVPPRVEWIPTLGSGYYGYYHSSYMAVYQPGYERIDTVVRLETRVFTAQDERLVWAGNTESFNPSSSEKVIRELAEIVVSDMKKSGLVR